MKGYRRFSDFMQEWLYAKDGYYANFREIGKKGDFYTAVSSSMFFGGSIANRLIKSIEEGFLSKNCTILEIGAHQGYLLADIVQFIYTLKPKLLETLKFAIVEPHTENIKAQKEYFKKSFGDFVTLKHYKDLKELSLDEAFIVSNEIFDAFACEIVKEDKQLYIDDNFDVTFGKMDNKIKDIAQKYGIEKGEIAVGYEEFASSLSKAVKKYEFITFDYGKMKTRGDFSIRIYSKHQVYPFFSLTKFAEDESLKDNVSLKTLFKKADITYDVHFAHLIDSFKKAGAKECLFKTQLTALVEFGLIELLDMLRKKVDEKSYQNELNRAKVLIDPAFMGERFKMLKCRKWED